MLEHANPWENRVELHIALPKEAARKYTRESKSPMVLWDYTIERRTLIHSTVPRHIFEAQGKTPNEHTFGNQSDISSFCNFGWCEWVNYSHHGSFPENKEKLGRIIGK